ncbi:hypothetical protein [Vulcanisaeta distributa]|uniref:hypothetical protein n=1 Tax=Vulcanisaeta distributa TaxID=164451 RepID=UPI0006D1C5DD|nr:hypothetical protein [Vulcanisaeta distributa]
MFEGKVVVAEQASELNNEDFMAFLLFAVLGDGNVNVEERRIRLTMGKAKREAWGYLIGRLRSLGFREYDDRHAINYEVWSSKAVDLIKKMLDNPSIKALIEDLSTLPDAEKLRRLTTLANAKIKPKGRSLVEVAGIKMNIRVNRDGYVELRVERYDYNDAKEILMKLKNAGYEEAKLSKRGNHFEVYMRMSTIKKYPELTTKTCEVLRKMLNEAVSEGNKKRAWEITKAITKLNCPTQSPRASKTTNHNKN